MLKKICGLLITALILCSLASPALAQEGENSCTTYTVQSGDTLGKIAQRNGLSLAVIITDNPQLADPDRIYPGQIVNICQHPESPPTGGEENTAPPADAGDPDSCIYTVQLGDTMSGIAQRKNLTLDTLAGLNPQVKDLSKIEVEQQISLCPGTVVPETPSEQTAPETEQSTDVAGASTEEDQLRAEEAQGSAGDAAGEFPYVPAKPTLVEMLIIGIVAIFVIGAIAGIGYLALFAKK